MKKTVVIISTGFLVSVMMFFLSTSPNRTKAFQAATSTLNISTVTSTLPFTPTASPTQSLTPTPILSKQDVHDVVATELAGVKESLATIETNTKSRPVTQSLEAIRDNLISNIIWGFVVEGGPKNQWIELIVAVLGLGTIGGNLALEINKKKEPPTWIVIVLRVLLYSYIIIFILILIYLFLSGGLEKSPSPAPLSNSQELNFLSDKFNHIEKQLESIETKLSYQSSNSSGFEKQDTFVQWLNRNTTVYPIIFALVSFIALFTQRRLFNNQNRVWRSEVLKSNIDKGNDKNFTQYVVLVLAIVILNYITAWPIDAIFLPFLAPFFTLFIYIKMQPYFSKAWFIPIQNRLGMLFFVFMLGAWWAFFDVIPGLIQQLIRSISNLFYVLPIGSEFVPFNILDSNMSFLFSWLVQALPIVFAVLFAVVAAKYLRKELEQKRIS